MAPDFCRKIRGISAWLWLTAGLLSVPLASSAQQDDLRRPDFSLPDLTGKPRSIAEWDGKALIINFWATWCVPCKREIPLFNEIDADYDNADLEILGIAIDTAENVNKYLQNTPMTYTTLAEENQGQEVAALFSSDPLVLPYTVFLDHAGRVFWMQVEEIHREQADVILSYIAKVKTGEMSYEEAQMQLVEAVRASLPAPAPAPVR
jgi:thiol-disulfide isomerase/thioredoxin